MQMGFVANPPSREDGDVSVLARVSRTAPGQKTQSCHCQSPASRATDDTETGTAAAAAGS